MLGGSKGEVEDEGGKKNKKRSTYGGRRKETRERLEGGGREGKERKKYRQGRRIEKEGSHH